MIESYYVIIFIQHSLAFYLGEVLGVTSTGLEHYAVTSSLTLPRTPEKDVFLILNILSCSI